jgi:hypothetical protein
MSSHPHSRPPIVTSTIARAGVLRRALSLYDLPRVAAHTGGGDRRGLLLLGAACGACVTAGSRRRPIARRRALGAPRPQPPHLLPAAVARITGQRRANPAAEPPLRVQPSTVTGGPIPGARVTADEARSASWGSPARWARSRSAVPSRLPPAGWLLSVGADGYGHRRGRLTWPAPRCWSSGAGERVAGGGSRRRARSADAGADRALRPQRTLADAKGASRVADLGPGPLTVEAYGRGHHGVLARPVNVSIATVVTDLRTGGRAHRLHRPRAGHGRGRASGWRGGRGRGREAVTDEAGALPARGKSAGRLLTRSACGTGVVTAAQPVAPGGVRNRGV